MARILEVYPSKDGVVRTALVRCRGEEYLRSVEFLVPLELDDEDEESIPVVELTDTVNVEKARTEQTGLASAGASPDDDEIVRAEQTGLTNVGNKESSTPAVEGSDSAVDASEVGDASPTPRASKRSRRPLRQAAERSRRLLAELIQQDAV